MNNLNNSPPQPLQPKVVKNAFAIMVAGQPLITETAVISHEKYLMKIDKPGLVKSFAISVLNPNQLPNNMGFAIYYSLPPFNQFEFVGVLHNEYPTGMFNAPWVDIKGITGCELAQIGFEVKSKDFLKSLQDKSESMALQKNNQLYAIKTEFAMKVAQNLYEFMSSFVKTTNDGQMLIAPSNVLNRWHDRFKSKYLKDPNFMKSG